ncbi:hypothetical protein [Lysinibacillus sp. BSL11]
MNLIESVSEISKQYAEKVEKFSTFVLKDRDIHGGLNFEEEIREIWINNGMWKIREYTEQTIQPDYGQTISKKEDIHVRELSNESLISLMTDGTLTTHEVYQITGKIVKELNLSSL